MAVHPADPNIAWFVPGTSDEKRCLVDGRVVVTRTQAMAARPSRRSREGCRSSTPTISCIVTRSTSMKRGKTLIFGSTTGSLWVSEDGGDSWQALSSHLPPVYAVTFEKRLN